MVLKDRPSRSGGDSEVDTPELIPNSEVKHFNGDNSWACPCEDSKLPGFFVLIFMSYCMRALRAYKLSTVQV